MWQTKKQKMEIEEAKQEKKREVERFDVVRTVDAKKVHVANLAKIQEVYLKEMLQLLEKEKKQ